METIVVEIVLASSGESADFILPAHVKVSALMPEIIRLMEQTHQALQIDREAPLLCDEGARRILPGSATLAQCGARQGQRLLLV